jgi:hypothetical protein
MLGIFASGIQINVLSFKTQAVGEGKRDRCSFVTVQAGKNGLKFVGFRTTVTL